MEFSTKFICATYDVCYFDHHVPSPYLRRTFDLSFVPEEAEITICGLGFYELWVNGKNVTKGPLAPYISNPNDVLYYDRYDLAGELVAGKNVIGIQLGNGFRNAFGGFVWDFDKSASRGPVAVALSLTAKKGEETFAMEADEQFRTHPSPITFDDERMGCHYDARLEIDGWCGSDFDDSDWKAALPCQTPAGVPKLCEADPIAVSDVIHPISVTHYDALPFAYDSNKNDAAPLAQTVRENVYVYDFGVNTAGIAVLKISGEPGQKITIRHAEHLQKEGFSINTVSFMRPETIDRYIEYGQKDVYILRGGAEEIFVPKFKYDGFRYAYVEGLLPHQATKDALTLYEMHSDVAPRAEFSSSCDTLNKLFEFGRRSDLANFYYFPTDCPHREKNGWTGDASVSAEHMLLNLHVEKSLREWLVNIRAAQRLDGALPGIVPTGGWGFDWGNGPVWDSVCVNLPYEIYRFTGDDTIIRENATLILRYLQYAMTRRDERGLVAFGLGDWVDPNQLINGKIAAPLWVTDSATICDMAKKAAFLFSAVGMQYESDYAAHVAADMRRAFRTHLIDFETMTVSGDCQTSQAIAIEVGFFEEDELDAARARLVEIIHRDGDVNACGMVGLRYIMHALIHAGEVDLCYRFMTAEDRTCYGAWVKHGATSLLENFPFEDGTAICSQNHHFLGDITSVMIQDLVGLRPNPDLVGTDTFRLTPVFPTALENACATFSVDRGIMRANWQKVGGRVKYSVEIPDGMHGTILTPKGYRLLGSQPAMLGGGKWEFLFEKQN